MTNVYEECPILENERWLLRLIEKGDAEDLLNVYGDKNALPFFNSDNCDGDNFYYPTIEQMDKAIDFWIYSYREKWFVRWVIIDKMISKAIGTVELFHRPYNGDFGEVGVLRLDVGSTYEKSGLLESLFGLILPPAYDLFDCDRIISKIPIYAVERMEAAKKCGFTESEQYLIGKGDYAYNGYWIIGRQKFGEQMTVYHYKDVKWFNKSVKVHGYCHQDSLGWDIDAKWYGESADEMIRIIKNSIIDNMAIAVAFHTFNDSHLLVLFKLDNGNYIPKSSCLSHYMLATGVVEYSDDVKSQVGHSRMIRVATIGDDLYFDYDQYIQYRNPVKTFSGVLRIL